MRKESGTYNKRLNDSTLKVGDIILSTTRSVIRTTIRTVTHSDISHAMVYVEHCSVIDATGGAPLQALGSVGDSKQGRHALDLNRS